MIGSSSMKASFRAGDRAITPPDAAAGRAVLLAIIDKAIERLRRLDAEHAEAEEILDWSKPRL